MAIFCKEWYLANAGTAGTAVADAHFITDLTGNAQRRAHQGADLGYPRIHAALGVSSLAAGVQTPGRSYGILTLLGSDEVDRSFDHYHFPIPWWGTIGDITAGDLQYMYTTISNERFNSNVLNMPYPEGSTLTEGTTSKIYGTVANDYTAVVLYQLAGSVAPPPRGGPWHVVTYDKGSDSTTVVWNTLENAAQNAAGELRKDHWYRLLWGAFDAQAAQDKEANLARVTVPDYPPLIFPGGGCYFNGVGMRRVWFLDDSILMDGDAVHKVEGHIGAACQPLVHLCWEDMGKGRKPR